MATEIALDRAALVGMHFEMPPHPLGLPLPWANYAPSSNYIGTVILNAWIQRELDHAGVKATTPDAIGATFGELNCCTGVWSVTDVGRGLRVVAGVLSAIYKSDPNDSAVELAWYCGAEEIWRTWRPLGPTKDFARHLTAEARERGYQKLTEIHAAMKAAADKFRRPS